MGDLDGDVGSRVSPVEDGPEVELRVSVRWKKVRPDGVALTANDGVNVRSCGR